MLLRPLPTPVLIPPTLWSSPLPLKALRFLGHPLFLFIIRCNHTNNLAASMCGLFENLQNESFYGNYWKIKTTNVVIPINETIALLYHLGLAEARSEQ